MNFIQETLGSVNEVKDNALLLLLYLYSLTHGRHPVNMDCLNEIIKIFEKRNEMMRHELQGDFVNHVTTNRPSLISFMWARKKWDLNLAVGTHCVQCERGRNPRLLRLILGN